MNKYIIQKDNTIQNIVVADSIEDVTLNPGETIIDYHSLSVGDLSPGAVLVDGKFVGIGTLNSDIVEGAIINGMSASVNLYPTKPIDNTLNVESFISISDPMKVENISVETNHISFDVVNPLPLEVAVAKEINLSLNISILKDIYNRNLEGISEYSFILDPSEV
jgi:hypothetical protein